MTSFGVVVPAYDGAAFLGDALDSLLRQSRPAEQVVVVDDGSSDGTALLAERHPLSPKVVRLDGNHGVAFARNTGAVTLDTDFVAFLDQDDMWLPTRLERLVALLSDHPSWDVVTTSEQAFAATEDREALSGHVFGEWVKHWVPREQSTELLDRLDPGPAVSESTELSLEHLLNWTVTVTTSYVIRRGTYFSVGGCAPWLRSGDDWILLQSLARHTSIHRIDDPTVLYRVHGSNTSLTTDWAIPLLCAAVGVRHGQVLVPRDAARDRDTVGRLTDSGFLMNLLATLARGSRGSGNLADALALWHLLGTDRADRSAALRRMAKVHARARLRWLSAVRRQRPRA